MKYLVILVSLLFVLKASAQDHSAVIKQRAQLMVNAVVKGDYKTLVALTYPPFVKAHGGTSTVMAAIKNAFDKMNSRGTSLLIKNVMLGDPRKEVKLGSSLYSVIPEKLLLNINGQDHATNSSLLAISDDNGRNWYYLDGNSKAELAESVPDIKKLNIPIDTPPVKVN